MAWWWWSGRPLPWLLVGACGLAVLLGCCLYFDGKRRSAPGFKRRLRETPSTTGIQLTTVSPKWISSRLTETERRKEHEKAKEREAELRELKETAKVQEFFLQEIQLGELWLARGEHKKSTEHLANAISVCRHPNQLMQVLEQTLPPQVFEMLVHSIPYAMQRLETALNEQDARDE